MEDRSVGDGSVPVDPFPSHISIRAMVAVVLASFCIYRVAIALAVPMLFFCGLLCTSEGCAIKIACGGFHTGHTFLISTRKNGSSRVFELELGWIVQSVKSH
jgi:hypothetical protein